MEMFFERRDHTLLVEIHAGLAEEDRSSVSDHLEIQIDPRHANKAELYSEDGVKRFVLPAVLTEDHLNMIGQRKMESNLLRDT